MKYPIDPYAWKTLHFRLQLGHPVVVLDKKRGDPGSNPKAVAGGHACMNAWRADVRKLGSVCPWQNFGWFWAPGSLQGWVGYGWFLGRKKLE